MEFPLFRGLALNEKISDLVGRTLLDSIIDSMDCSPDEWEITEHGAKHKSGLYIWHYLSVFPYVMRPSQRKFGLIGGWRLLRSLQFLKDLKSQMMLEQPGVSQDD